MHRLVHVLCLVVSLPISAHATSNISNASCSSGLTRELVNGASFACACNSSNTVIQNTSNKILNWSEFNIEQSATVNFIQGQPTKTILNSVLGTNQTSSGVLTIDSGGNISLVNTNGVILQPSVTPLTPGGNLMIGSGAGGLVTTGNNTYTPPISLSAVPEPSTYLTVLLGLGLITYRRQFKH